MSIVERLRTGLDWDYSEQNTGVLIQYGDTLLTEAADEIESLEAEIEQLKAEKEHYIKVWSDVCDENQGLLNEIERLREALDLLWANANHEEWDAMAREHFERLIRGWK
jgi:chromosome segregation ATPase